MMVVEDNVEVWGTWEELVLGGAVLRHGTEDWKAVALELRSRVLSPRYFTPEVCEAKYEDLRKLFSYEDLRKRRVEDLKRGLEKSNDAIGSLESRVKRLKAERCSSDQIVHVTPADSPATLIKSEDVEYSGRETPKDGLSAGSYTHDTLFNCLSECRTPAVTSMSLSDMKTEISRCHEEEEGCNDIKKNVEDNCKQVGLTIRKRRGKRRRKDSCAKDAKEGSIPESDNLGPPTNASFSASHSKETSASECNQTIISSGTDGHSRDLSRVRSGGDVMGIFISIAQNESASVFKHRLDGQKRARYKKTIRQHLDFGIIRSRIVDGSIISVKELFRDLLLLANNALVFYSKRTRAYKSAFSLRGIIMKAYRQHCQDSYNKATSRYLSLSSPLSNPPSKPRSARPRPCKHKSSLKLQCTNETGETPGDNEKLVDLDSNLPLMSLLVAKKSSKRPATVKPGLSSSSKPKASSKERKKVAKQT